MKYLTPQIIADITDGRYVGKDNVRNIRIRGAVRDNRHVQPGNLFVCIKGANVDGHSFANDAFEAGAACCLAEQEIADAEGPYVVVSSTLEAIMTIGAYYRNLFDIPVVGITGSVGKTSAKELIAAVLGEKFNTLRTTGNLNNELGVPLTLLSLDETHEAAVIEMGINDFGEMSRLAQMARPDIFVMTKIGYAHLDNLGDLNGVLKAKTEAFAYMSSDGVAVLNGDDDLLWDYDPGLRRVMYGLTERNDIRIENVKSDGTSTISCTVALNTGGQITCVQARTQGNRSPLFAVTVPAYGSHIVELMGSAVAVGVLLGLTNEEIAHGFKKYSPIDGRSNVTDTGEITIIDDCYNANPNSVRAALTSLAQLEKRRVAILGDMFDLGEQSDELHMEMGSLAASQGIDCLICCGDSAKFILKGFLSLDADTPVDKDGAYGDKAHYYSEKDKLISALPELIKKDDAVLIKASNGMKFDEIVEKLKN